MNPVKTIILGAGDRGNAYAEYSKYRDNEMKIVGVAEPCEYYRNGFVKKYSIEKKYIFETWEDALEFQKFADAVIIAMPDRMHYAPAIKSLKKDYNILIEKPMAPTKDECIEMVKASKKYKKVFSI
ncbi:MAG: Gfo/Idh/MocA family oxidoreductase [Actinomycetia bacterium]|nr:Gfo/Idh/MocA family oxidoreductase [Actinomycetes bacterium]